MALSIIRRYEHLGVRELPDGTLLVGHVPQIAPEAYLHIVFPRLLDAQVDGIESSIGIKLPEDLRELFLLCNGIELFAGSLSLLGLRTTYSRSVESAWQPYSIIEPNVEERTPGAPKSAVFFGFYNWDGSLLYAQSNTPLVHRCSRNSSAPIGTWASVGDMIAAEASRLSRLFDDDGNKIDKLAATV